MKEGPTRPTIRTFEQMQEVYGHFSRGLNPDRSPLEIHDMLVTEVDELKEALEGRNYHEIAAELADVVMFSIEIANQHGIPLDEALSAKMNRNYHKYNPFEMQQLICQGMSRDQAQAFLKAKWDRSRDKDFK